MMVSYSSRIGVAKTGIHEFFERIQILWIDFIPRRARGIANIQNDSSIV
jgi:hypothetical protein